MPGADCKHFPPTALGNRNEQTPWVSVLIPTYNRCDELRETLSSLRQQTYGAHGRLEVLVLDDASTDETPEMVLEEFPEVRYTRLPSNRGQAYGRNVLVASSRGEYLVLLDDDARFIDDWAIERAVEILNARSEIALVLFNLETPSQPAEPSDTAPHYTHDHMAGASAVRRRAMLEAGGYRSLFHSGSEESDLSLRLLNKGWLLYRTYDIRVFHNFVPTLRPRQWLRWVRHNTARNDLSMVLLQFPLRMVLPALVWKTVSHIRCGWRLGITGTFLQAIGAFLIRSPHLIRLRRPVSMATLKRYYGLRRFRPTEIDQIHAIERLPWRAILLGVRNQEAGLLRVGTGAVPLGQGIHGDD